ncbi:MAG: valine--tRNA ligase, partial [Halothiobacillus sp. 20-53-49]
GTDALRFTFAALATTGRDIRFDLSRIDGYRNFCNKLWNASRFVMMQCEDQDTGCTDAPVVLNAADQWIISRLQQVELEVAKHFADYRFDLAAQTLYEFTWNEYCDWYLEFTKPALKSGDADAERGTRRTLVRVLEAVLRLLHPIIPFITETIWQRLAPLALPEQNRVESILARPYPQADASKIKPLALESVEWLKAVILGVRRIRAEMDIAPSKMLDVLATGATAAEIQRFTEFSAILVQVGRISSVTPLADHAALPEAAMTLVGALHIHIPLAGLIDKTAELARLAREIAKNEAELAKARSKLESPGFADRAPPAVVAQERERADKFAASLADLAAQYSRIERL